MKLTYFPSKEYILNKLILIDADKKQLGKLASMISLIVQGKNSYTYQQSIIQKNKVIVINCAKMHFSSKKKFEKNYYHHSSFIGGLKKEKMKDIYNNSPTKILRYSILKMLPKNSLRNLFMKNIKLYSDNINPYNLNTLKKIIY